MEEHSKKLKNIKKVSGGFLKKYLLEYDTEEQMGYEYELVSRNEINDESDLGKKGNAVCIVPIFHSDRSLVVCREFRYAINDYVYAFPAGLIDEGESVEQAAKRELKEETGLDLTKILKSYPASFSSVGMTDERVAVVVCYVEGEIKDSTGMEEIYPIKMTFEEAERIISGQGNKISCRFQCLMIGATLLFHENE